MKGLTILLVDDEPLMRLSMVDAMEAVGYEVRAASTGTEGIQLLRQNPFDLVITDLRLPGADGLAVLKATKEAAPETEVVVITAHGSMETAVGAMRLGAFDYITKPFQMDELLLIVERVGRVVRLRRETEESKEIHDDNFRFGGILGANSRMREVLDKVRTAAGSDVPVLILGESGTGKELVANAIHQNSPRNHHPLIKVSCGALSEALLDAELFGHEKGAFAGASRQRRGRFELAHRGTLFLDEISELPAGIQDKVLRLLQERKFWRLGGRESIEVDVRLVGATRVDLAQAVEKGRFHEDLYRRLNTVQVTLPPLRQRTDDIMIIADHLLHDYSSRMNKRLKGFSPSARDLLSRYSFPGNVRELEKIIERGVTTGRDHEMVHPADLCEFPSCPFTGGGPQESCGFCHEGLAAESKSKGVSLTSLSAAREEFEKSHILSVLERVEGNRTAAAKVLGLSRKALGDKCKRYGIPSVTEDAGEEGE
ncbi:fused response regulator of ato opeon, in two-component system with AtoS: response regulator; sigma54 interaction protein [Nitrospira japonica]|uniref:Fused response regulator of ato opeon, in two-component system with AtoS: response regulator sigma54 interaction protein n=1 Tax=Nitrospira japonica TaxID=1325564 RepID=A0A1W1HZW7_9BACT|nr:sigma-54 dependent transcriptional regulator [Nitrospira japonica]SLM46291.1 fused response regulator of ato opeon, in two-component system with AtoS: response regulator; sigma54 interaction protein [Nitrospira japonica]